jgi:hypothetical protein
VSDPTHAYIGVRRCGCVLAATVDDGRISVPDDLRDFAKDGLTIERVTIEESMQRFGKCEMHEADP